MKEDAVMQRIHKAQREMFRESGGDLKKIFEQIKKLETGHAHHVISSAKTTKDKK